MGYMGILLCYWAIQYSIYFRETIGFRVWVDVDGKTGAIKCHRLCGKEEARRFVDGQLVNAVEPKR